MLGLRQAIQDRSQFHRPELSLPIAWPVSHGPSNRSTVLQNTQAGDIAAPREQGVQNLTIAHFKNRIVPPRRVPNVVRPFRERVHRFRRIASRVPPPLEHGSQLHPGSSQPASRGRTSKPRKSLLHRGEPSEEGVAIEDFEIKRNRTNIPTGCFQ